MAVKETIEGLLNRINESPEGISGVNVTYQFNLSGEEAGVYQLKFAEQTGKLIEGENEKANCTLKLSDKNFLKLINGTLNPTTAFMMGKVKIEGDLGLAMKLQSILGKYQSA
ncbi:SCP2 sterol-binding domain-containing protein [Bacillus massilinigeriensis]|uniref:SCP2 sterol-binding domain-containing protein n=1 Tax=Bacillus massilionigeriensis TaxID=1805475 RepID=UPI00096AFFA3|nr:SCP2 sterol-binding domain-containing protein [Bacillus massilionigeriensis]